MKYYIDTEFDGHNGPLISLALVPEKREWQDFYFLTTHTGDDIQDPWVRENVDTIVLDNPNKRCHMHMAHVDHIYKAIRDYLRDITDPIFVADSPVDIARIANILSSDGKNWTPSKFETITFEVHNVDCYPTTLEGAVQHNAWWDAMALREKLNELG